MKRALIATSLLSVSGLLLSLGVAEAAAQRPALKRKPVAKRPAARPAPPANPLYTVSAGTLMRVRMNQTITSRTANVGNTFTATVTEPVYSTNGVVVIPVGSTVTGRVDGVKRAGKGGEVGEIDARFTSIRLPNGRTRAINGSLSSLEADGVNVDDEGSATGRKMQNRKLIFIGGGGAGGAIIGAAIGGGRGAAIGGILGAGGGLLGERLTKGREAEVKSGTEFGVYINQAISMPRFAESTSARP